MKRKLLTVLVISLLLGFAACAPAQQSAEPEQEAVATPAQEPEATPTPTPLPEATATPEPTETPAPTDTPDNESDIVQLLKMTRADVEAKYGAGKSVVYDSIDAFEENGEAIDGFPVAYENLQNVMIFFDAEAPSSDSAKPYAPKEQPADKVIGVKLIPGSEPFNVKGYVAALAPADYDKHKKEVTLYDGSYFLDVKLGTLRYVWVSKKKDMSDSCLFVCNK